MSVATHTPGPWSLPHFVTEGRCQCGYVFSDQQQGMGAIATVHYAGDGDDPAEPCGFQNEPIERAKANARLIAAAPTLLDILKLIANLTGDKQPKYARDVYKLATAAIGKATGAKAEQSA